MIHFQHLTNDGFLGVAETLEDHIGQLSAELASTGDHKDGSEITRRFVGSFCVPMASIRRPHRNLWPKQKRWLGSLREGQPDGEMGRAAADPAASLRVDRCALRSIKIDRSTEQKRRSSSDKEKAATRIGRRRATMTTIGRGSHDCPGRA